MTLSLLLLFCGLALLIAGSHLLVGSLKAFSLHFKLSPLFLSIVVLGFVSSSPEWFVTVTASFKKLPSAALGNIVGSNVINILLVLALTGLVFPLSRERQIMRFDLPVLISGMGLLGLFSLDRRIGFIESLFLLAVFTAYIILLLQKRKNKGKAVSAPPSSGFSLLRSGLALAGGFVLLFSGSWLAVDSSIALVNLLGLTERFAGVFVLSFSTSLPELSASLQAIFKKEGAMALGNIIGSNIFNSFFILGSAGVLQSLSWAPGLYFDWFVMTAVTGLLFAGFFFFEKLPKSLCALFIGLYALYIVFVSGVFS